MKKGGYKIIDFKGTSLSGTAVTMTDILTSLKENYGKVVLLTGIIIGDTTMDDCFSTVLDDGNGGCKLNCYDGYITVNDDGEITYTSADISNINSLLENSSQKIVFSLNSNTSKTFVFSKSADGLIITYGNVTKSFSISIFRNASSNSISIETPWEPANAFISLTASGNELTITNTNDENRVISCVLYTFIGKATEKTT